MSSDHIHAPDAGPTRPYHHGALADALIDAVAAIVREEGVEHVTTRAAARRAGVSSSAAFRHFADKRDLMTAVAARAHAAMNALVRERLAAAGPDPVARFRAVGEGYLLFAAREPGLFRAMFRTDAIRSDDPRLRAEAAELEAHLRDGLKAVAPPGEDEAALRAKELLAWGLVHGLAVLGVEGQLDDLLPPEGRAATLADLIGLMRVVFEAPAQAPAQAPADG